ncbi:hypothetical protein L208DRAFT_1377116 [Tricholoma matsutake]|nr:hypothetical protein L208DRAFT_1377116 [Tricholoma matsutake 945]
MEVLASLLTFKSKQLGAPHEGWTLGGSSGDDGDEVGTMEALHEHRGERQSRKHSPSGKDEQHNVKLEKGDGVKPQEWGLGTNDLTVALRGTLVEIENLKRYELKRKKKSWTVVLRVGLWFLRPAGPSVKIWLEDKGICGGVEILSRQKMYSPIFAQYSPIQANDAMMR